MRSWTPQKIFSELNKKGIDLNQLIRENKIDITNFNELERCIAEALGVPLQTIWPSRYTSQNRRIKVIHNKKD